MQNQEPTHPPTGGGSPEASILDRQPTLQSNSTTGADDAERTEADGMQPGAGTQPPTMHGKFPTGTGAATPTQTGSTQQSGSIQPPTRPQPAQPVTRRKKWILLLLLALIIVLIISAILYNTQTSAPNSGFFPLNNGHPDGAADTHPGPATQSFQVNGHPLVVIKGHGSDVNIHSGASGTVIMKARKHGSTFGPDVNDTKIQYDQSNDPQGHSKINIKSDPIFRDIDYDVTVPSAALVQVEVNSGSVAADGISGITIDTGAGSIDVENIQGPADVHTESGDITARTIKGQMTLTAGSGSIRMTGVTGQLKATTRSGDVTARAAALSGQSALKTSSGSIRVQGSLDPQGSYRMETNSGDIDLTLPDNAVFQLDATTGSGSVHNEFGNNIVGGTPHAQITLSIGSGSVSVHKGA